MTIKLRSATRVALTLPLFLALCSSAQAQAPGLSRPSVQAPESSVDPELARDLRRILHLRGGSVFRGRTRQVDGAWQLRTDGSWVALPTGAVGRFSTERDVLAQARRLEQEVGRDLGLRRVALADWMAREGLLTEALEQFDRVLTADPTQNDALRLLAAPDRNLQVFRSVQSAAELLRKPPATPALRELALARLAELEDRAVIYEHLRGDLDSRSSRSRAFAAQGLGRLFPGEELEPLLGRAVLDGNADVRAEASRALGAAGDPTLVLPVLRALESNYSGVRENAAEALGAMAYPVAVEPLVGRLAAISKPGAAASNAPYRSPGSVLFIGKQTAFVQDYDVEVATGSSIADPQVNVLSEGSVLDVRVHGISTAGGYAGERRRIAKSLTQLTGADPGSSAKAWSAWLAEHADDATAAAAAAGTGDS